MVNQRCVVRGCDNTTGTKKKKRVSFHEFPSNAILRGRWISEMRKHEGLKRDFSDGDELFRKNCVCGEHFTAPNYRIYCNSTLRLKHDAAPDNWKTNTTSKFLVETCKVWTKVIFFRSLFSH